ncbi:MAG: HEAT repeat domain-containing protein, partial [Candidatus Riflebacteria bacterium]|nr:HEAT repeat domain-containing protein [Candidatus Riflebacteria bacterium]
MEQAQIQVILAKLEPLLDTLIATFKSGDYAQRREAAIALSKFKGERATDFLLRTFETDNIQDFMALALGNIESQKAVSLLMNALNDSQQEVRFNAAQALGMIKNDEALNVLMEALNEYADANVAGSAQQPGGGRLFFEEDAIISAITALGRIKSQFSIPLLKRLLAQEKSPRIRSTIIMALGGMANDRLLPIFQNALRDEDARVRSNAIEAIESIKSSSIVGIIQPYLEDPNNRVRANVAKAIFKYGDFDVSETLAQMLGHDDKWFRSSAAYAMGEIRDVRFIPRLAQALKDEDPDVRRNATNALRKIESANAIPHLIPLLEDPNYDVRVQAVIALARCSPDKAVDLFTQKLAQEENSIVRATLVSCLGDCAGAGHQEILARYLDDPDPRVVSNTIEAIQKVSRRKPDPGMITQLENLLSHEDNRVKSNAIKALWIWNEFSVLDNLHDLLHNTDEKHRQSAVFVLGEIGQAIARSKALTQAVNDLIARLVESRSAGVATAGQAAAGQAAAGQAAAGPPPPPP